jgi:hypothetical protein
MVEQMIAAKAPLPEILSTLVCMIEVQSPGMLCSVLLLSADGNHVEHGVAPNLPADYVKAIDGSPIGLPIMARAARRCIVESAWW